MALFQIKKLLKPDGKLVIAGEVQPENAFKRMAHFLVRLPLALKPGQNHSQTYRKKLPNQGSQLLKKSVRFLIVLSCYQQIIPIKPMIIG